MAGGSGGALNLDLDGSHVRVDALEARMVSLVAAGPGRPTITVQPASGQALSGELPAEARQATFRIREALTVEATSTAAFVALAGEDRSVVITYAGEVTVAPGGDDRFALGPDEALVIGSAGTTPSVVAVADLTADAYPDVSDLVEAAAEAAFGAGEPASAEAVAPSSAAASTEEKAPDEPAPPGEEVADVAATPGDRKPSGAAKAAKAAKKAAKAPAPAGGAGGRRKKAKKGRPQPQRGGGPAKAAAAAASATTSPPGGGGKSGGGGKGGGNGRGGGNGGGGGGHDGDSYEDTPRDRRFLVGAVLVALVLAVGAVLLLSNVDDDGETEVASESTTTEAGAADTTTSTAVTTTAPATTTSTSPPTTTPTSTAPTTTARATTTTAAPPRYEIEPKSCVQEGASITYVATVRNTADVPYDFTMEVAFVTPDGSRVAEATANVSRLGAGRSADLSATGRSNRDLAGSGAQCQLTRFDATPSG